MSTVNLPSLTHANRHAAGGPDALTPSAIGAPADLADTPVTAGSGTLGLGQNSNVTTAGGTFTAPAPAATVSMPPQRFAVTNASTGNVTLTFPNTAGNSIALTVLPGEVVTFRQSSTSGYKSESGNKPLAQLDLRYPVTPSTLAGITQVLETTAAQAAGAPATFNWTTSKAQTARDFGWKVVTDPQWAGGAKVDGATDDTAAVQAALNSGGTVYIPAGNCITTALSFPVGARLKGTAGSGAPGIIPGITQRSVLRRKIGSTAGAFITFPTGAGPCTLESLEIDCNGQFGTAISLPDSAGGEESQLYLANLYIHDTSITPAATAGSAWSDGDGIYVGNGRRAVQGFRIYQRSIARHGFNILGSDSEWHMCSAVCNWSGWRLWAAATRVVGGQSYGNGSAPGAGITATITAVSATGSSTTTVTTSAAHGLTDGMPASITGVGGATAVNGIWTPTVTAYNQFTIPVTNSTAWTSGGVTRTSAASNVVNVSSGGSSPTTITTDIPHGITNGSLVSITGALGAIVAGGVNGLFTATVTSSTAFTIPVANSTAFTAGGVVRNMTTHDVSAVSTGGSPTTITTSTAHGLVTGMMVFVSMPSGSGSTNLQGVYTVTVTSTTQFTIPTSNSTAFNTGAGAGIHSLAPALHIGNAAPDIHVTQHGTDRNFFSGVIFDIGCGQSTYVQGMAHSNGQQCDAIWSNFEVNSQNASVALVANCHASQANTYPNRPAYMVRTWNGSSWLDAGNIRGTVATSQYTNATSINANSYGNYTVQSFNSGAVGLSIRGAASQTAALLRFLDSNGNVRGRFYDGLGRPYTFPATLALPTVVPNANAGTSATAVVASGTDSEHVVTLTTGSGSLGAGNMFTVTFGTAYTGTPKIWVQAIAPGGGTAPSTWQCIHSVDASATGYTLVMQTAPASTTAKFNVKVVG